jgi:hypothetical protein
MPTQHLDDGARGGIRGAGLKRRARRVFDAELDKLRHPIAGEARRQDECHVDTGGHAARGHDFAVDNHAIRNRLGAELRELVKCQRVGGGLSPVKDPNVTVVLGRRLRTS